MDLTMLNYNTSVICMNIFFEYQCQLSLYYTLFFLTRFFSTGVHQTAINKIDVFILKCDIFDVFSKKKT